MSLIERIKGNTITEEEIELRYGRVDRSRGDVRVSRYNSRGELVGEPFLLRVIPKNSFEFRYTH